MGNVAELERALAAERERVAALTAQLAAAYTPEALQAAFSELGSLYPRRKPSPSGEDLAGLARSEGGAASIPEPPPLRLGEPVTPPLLAWIESRGRAEAHRIPPEHTQAALELVRARDTFGRAKYGQGLLTGDGRNTVEDARQELGDFLQYLYKAHLNGEDLTPLAGPMRFALDLYYYTLDNAKRPRPEPEVDA